MEYRTLGRTGWRVAEISCGTYRTFDVAGGAGSRQVEQLMRANLTLGCNLFDSAPMYGHSEANIGHAMPSLEGGQEGGAAGDSAGDADGGTPFFIATKVLQHDLAGARRQIENSFRVIGGRIDLLQIHNMAGWRQVLPYLVELKAAGRIRATGITHYDPSAFAEIELAMKTGQADVIQIPYNIMERQVERRLLPLAREMGLGVLVMTPIRPMGRRGELLDLLPEAELAALRAYGVSDSGSLCLKYLLSKNPDVILIPATSRPERVASNGLVSGAPPLPPDIVKQLETRIGG